MNKETTLADALSASFYFAEEPTPGEVVTAASKIDEALAHLPAKRRAHAALSYFLFQHNVRMSD